MKEPDKSRIYNFDRPKKTAELLRKDLISAMKLPDHEVLDRNDYILINDPWRQEWEKGVQVPVNPDSLPVANVTMAVDSCVSKSERTFKQPKKLIQVVICFVPYCFKIVFYSSNRFVTIKHHHMNWTCWIYVG